MYSACVTELNGLKGSLAKGLEFIDWKRQVKTGYTAFIKPNFTFPYYKERITTSPELLRNLLEMFGDNHGVIYVDKLEDVVKKTVKLMGNGGVKEEGRKARKFVEKYRGGPVIAFGTKNFASFWIESSICLSFSSDFELLDSLYSWKNIPDEFGEILEEIVDSRGEMYNGY